MGTLTIIGSEKGVNESVVNLVRADQNHTLNVH